MKFGISTPREILSLLGPRYRETNFKFKKNKIGISFSLWDANGEKIFILASSSPRDLENRIHHQTMIRFDGANVSGRRTCDLLTFCEIIFGDPTGGPTGGLRSQVSGPRSQVSGPGHRSQVSGLRSHVSGLSSQVSGLRSLVSGLRSRSLGVFGVSL